MGMERLGFEEALALHEVTWISRLFIPSWFSVCQSSRCGRHIHLDKTDSTMSWYTAVHHDGIDKTMGNSTCPWYCYQGRWTVFSWFSWLSFAMIWWRSSCHLIVFIGIWDCLLSSVIVISFIGAFDFLQISQRMLSHLDSRMLVSRLTSRFSSLF